MARRRPQTSSAVLRQWLTAQSAQALQALLLDAAECDPALRQRLLSQAQLASAPPQDWRKAVSALLGRKRFMDYDDSIAYAKRLRPLDALLEQARQRDPAAALTMCDRLIETAIERTHRRGYLEAVELLPTRQRLCAASGDLDGFAAYLDHLRKRYQRKRNFIELLDTRLAAAAKPRRR